MKENKQKSTIIYASVLKKISGIEAAIIVDNPDVISSIRESIAKTMEDLGIKKGVEVESDGEIISIAAPIPFHFVMKRLGDGENMYPFINKLDWSLGPESIMVGLEFNLETEELKEHLASTTII